MTWANYDDVVRQIEGCGLVLDKPLTFDARIQRWKVTGEDNERRGWTRLKEWTSKAGNTYIVGTFGIWHGTDDGRMKIEINRETTQLSRDDLEAMRKAHQEAERRLKEERKFDAKTAAAWAATVWAGCAPCTEHDYLARKGIQAHGLRVLNSTESITLAGVDDSNHYRLKCAIGALVVPMHDQHGNVNGIQFIYPRGHARSKKIERDKEFWPAGMAMGGSFGVIGPIQRNGILLVAEGYATAATLFEASGQSVAYAFSANNLAKAGKILRKQYPRLRLLFAADDDYLTTGNPGCSHAAQATAEIEKTAWFKPDFSDEAGADRRDGKKLTDFNDLFALAGSPLPVAAQVAAKLDELKWRDGGGGGRITPPSGGGGSSPEGGGDDRMGARAVMSIDELVDRFIPIDDGTGKVLFDTWTARIVQSTQMTALTPAGQRLDDIKRHPVWAQRGAYYVDQIGFDPSGEERNVKLNTWRGWPMKPASGKCDLLIELLEYLCSGEGPRPDVVQWCLRWMAYPLQHPGAKMQSAIMLHGPQGTGKSTIFKVLAQIYGDLDSYRNYAVILDQRALESQFNSDWDSKLFVLAEEVINSSDKWQLKNELKELVTGHRIRIQRKFVDAYYQTNRCNIVFLSNEDQPLPLDNDDRRHLVIWTPPPVSEQVYADVREEMATGGIEAFYHYLMTLDLGDFKPWSRPPMTEAKAALINASRSSEDEFLQDWVNGETIYPVCPMKGDDLFEAYVRHCQKNRERNIASRRRFRIKLAHLQDWSHRKQTYVYDSHHFEGKARQVRLEIPGDTWLQRAAARGKEFDYRKEPGEDIAEWATRCMLAFSAKLREDEMNRLAA
jgi:putative DNA primase/helicase